MKKLKNFKGLCKLEKQINYKFKNFDLLIIAMIHSSYINEHKIYCIKSNERMEFLGDSVLGLISSDFLFKKYFYISEGELTKKRARIVCKSTLVSCAKKISLSKYLFLSKGEELTGGREKNSIIANAIESLIGAIYLDSNFYVTKKIVKSIILNNIKNKKMFHDNKTILQEIVQCNNDIVHYTLIKEEGPDHNKYFHTQVLLGDNILGYGIGHTKKASEQEAAFFAIKKIMYSNEKNIILHKK